MQILLACAKIMTGQVPRHLPLTTEPQFQREANDNALRMARFSREELREVLGVNKEIATENFLRFQSFFDETTRQPAVFSYDGMVFQKLVPETFSDAELQYANGHLFIGSFLYGLLRPLDLVNRYRMEGNVVLPGNEMTMFDYWKPRLTDWFIEKVKADDGILVNLASDEFRGLFDWRRVKKELEIVTPQFKVEKAGRLKTIVIYTKMCRGAMTKWILQNRITSTDALKAFEYEGFRYDATAGDWLFVNR
ncbi:YaaA family protein [Palleniella muris]|uniref:YaaA family protein n=1 Tax=Palleniella muris TaxID=3038145 RepID=A0AC61QNQ2_9BACT|nr:YaaA family protein [Palleniella muris]TGX81319.1 YaaA family protein [Palleniella muris]